jgi:predicted SnoaL-like aldol condensation-catalyzing enzyme
MIHVQHNPHTQEGTEGLAKLFGRLSKSDPKVTMVCGFEDGDFVFSHMECDFSHVKVAFEVFRFENGFAVEHWDNNQPKFGPNLSGRSMLDGQTESKDKHKTEIDRVLVNDYVKKVLIDSKEFIQHNPSPPDGIEALRLALLAT